MMIDVKKRNLIQITFQQHNVRIEILVQFGNVKNVDPIGHANFPLVVRLQKVADSRTRIRKQKERKMMNGVRLDSTISIFSLRANTLTHTHTNALVLSYKRERVTILTHLCPKVVFVDVRLVARVQEHE